MFFRRRTRASGHRAFRRGEGRVRVAGPDAAPGWVDQRDPLQQAEPRTGRRAVEVWNSADGTAWTKRGVPAPNDPETNRMNHAAGLAKNGDLLVLVSGWTNLKQPQRPSRPTSATTSYRPGSVAASTAAGPGRRSRSFPRPMRAGRITFPSATSSRARTARSMSHATAANSPTLPKAPRRRATGPGISAAMTMAGRGGGFR